jgi:uncharacterized protein (UPF0261 family)
MAEDRLGLAGEKGLPQVIVPGGLDMFIFPGTRETVPEEFKDRPLHAHGPDRILVRTIGEEVATAARVLAKRANQAKGPIAIVIPLRGFSAVDRSGLHFHNPEADNVFGRVIRENVNKGVEIVEVDAHINDNGFARAVVYTFDKLVKRGGVSHGKKV